MDSLFHITGTEGRGSGGALGVGFGAAYALRYARYFLVTKKVPKEVPGLLMRVPSHRSANLGAQQ